MHKHTHTQLQRDSNEFNVLHFQKVLNHLHAVVGEDALRVELHTLDLVLLVTDPHDHIAVLERRRDFELFGQRLRLADERVIPNRLELRWDAREESLAVIRHRRLLAVHDLARMHYCATKDLKDRLVAEADTGNRELTRKRADDVQRDARVLWEPRTRRDHNAVDVHLLNLLDRHLIIASHVHLGAQLCHVLVDVVRERVVVVNEQHAGGRHGVYLSILPPSSMNAAVVAKATASPRCSPHFLVSASTSCHVGCAISELFT